MNRRKDGDTRDVGTWLAKRGVSKKNIEKFLDESGCTTLDNMALYLRLQLSPLDLANTDCVNIEMAEIMGVTGKRARAIIKDLNVFGALDLDIHDAATTHLLATGTLGDTQTIHRSANTTPNSVTFPEPHSASGLRPSPASRGSPHLSPLPGDKEMCTPWSMAPDAPRDISRGPGPDFREPNPAGGDSFVLQPPVSDPNAADGQIQLPTSQDVNDHAFANPLYRTFGAMSGGGRSGSTAADPSALSSIRSGGQAGVPPGESGGFLSAASSYLKTPYHSYMSAQVDASASHPPMSTGNPLQPFSVSELPGEEHHAESATHVDSMMQTGGPYSTVTPHSARSHCEAVDSLISIPHTGHASGRSRGLPTVSQAFEPGPYHQANAQLRRQLPHYHAHMKVVLHWDQVFWCIMAVCTFVLYMGVRGYYLATGRTAEIAGQDVSVTYSWIILIAEFFLTCCGVYSNQLFWKQETTFTRLTPKEYADLAKDVAANGTKQTVHVCVCTYNETAELVREGVIRLLVAPEPIYMEKIIYVCDDGHAKAEGPKKRAMVEQLQALGHTNVKYIGDRMKKPGTLNGKSANLNHVIFRKIYPHARRPEHIPERDILMVMDCDHMVKPDIYNRMAPCMLHDMNMAVVLVPQSFFNLIIPDSFDTAGKDFTFIKMPFAFGASIIYITGTNFFMRARAAFDVSEYMEVQGYKDAVLAADADTAAKGESGAVDRVAPLNRNPLEDVPMIFAEDKISEDIDLGSRLHAAGFKAAFIAERLATGETPLDPRGMWRQRLRWFKGGHLFLFSKNSVFFKNDNHLTLYHKALYFFGPTTHFVMFVFEPFITTLPFMCLVFRVCPYGMDPILFWTHFAHIGISFFASVYDRSFDHILTGICAKGGIRILYFTAFKACVNTVMVALGYKKPGAFKITRKVGDMAGGEDGRGEVDEEEVSISTAVDAKVKATLSNASGDRSEEEAHDDAVPVGGSGSGSGRNRGLANAGRVDSELSLRNSALDLNGLQRPAEAARANSPGRVTGGRKERGGGEAAGAERMEDRAWDLTHVHAKLSKVTDVRKKFMPLDGTLDIWVLGIRLLISLTAAGFGIYRIAERDALVRWEERSTLIWLAIAFAIVDSTPGLLYFGYLATYSWAPQLLKVYSPLVLAVVIGGVIFIELRVIAGYVLEQ
eukprot:jgi/Ulvmu1/9401/UM051_0029.1